METKQEYEARLRRLADIGRAYIVRYRETGEGKPIPPPKPWLYANETGHVVAIVSEVYVQPESKHEPT